MIDATAALMSRVFLRAGQDPNLGATLLAANVAAVRGDIEPLRRIIAAEQVEVLAELEAMAAIDVNNPDGVELDA